MGVKLFGFFKGTSSIIKNGFRDDWLIARTTFWPMQTKQNLEFGLTH